jgi:hypothetical protein
MTTISLISSPSLRCCALVGGMLLLSGCGEGNRAMPAPSNSEVARQALEKALSQWQAGQTAESLAAASPQVYVNDFDWKDGRKLKQFQVAGPTEEVGLQVRLPVALDVEQATGQVVRSQVSYSVSTSPVVSIVRDDP